MALATGAGTETLHAHHFEDVSAATTQNLIVGVQHHIYTVLSIICFAKKAFSVVPSGSMYISITFVAEPL